MTNKLTQSRRNGDSRSRLGTLVNDVVGVGIWEEGSGTRDGTEGMLDKNYLVDVTRKIFVFSLVLCRGEFQDVFKEKGNLIHGCRSIAECSGSLETRGN